MEKHNRILLVLKYLRENTDIEHPATIRDIIEYLSQNGYSVTRKTVTSDINDLISFGVDIDCQRSTQNRYFLDVRVFELAEVVFFLAGFSAFAADLPAPAAGFAAFSIFLM